MALTDTTSRNGDVAGPEVPQRVKAFRVIGASAIFVISANMVACLARGTYTDAAALTPFAVAIPIAALSVYICREELKESLRSAHFRALFHFVAQAGLGLLAVAFLLYLFGHRFHVRVDVSSDGFNELAGESRKTLQGLATIPEPVEMVLLEGEQESTPREREHGRRIRTRISELLRAYQATADALARGKMMFRTLNMLAQPGKLQILAERTGLTFTREMADGIVLLRGDRTKLVLKRELFGVGSYTADGRALPAFQGEAMITGALHSLLQDERKTVYYGVGHGEHAEKDTSKFRKMLAGQNLNVRELDVSVDPRVPDDAAALIICGPRQAYDTAGIKALESYLGRGGRLMLLVDPVLPVHAAMAREACGLSPLLGTFGLRPRQDLMTRMFRPDVLGSLVPADRFPAVPNQRSASPILFPIRLERTPVSFAFPCALQTVSVEGALSAEILLEAVERGGTRTWASPPAKAHATEEGPGPEGMKAPVPLAAWCRMDGGKASPSEGTRIVVVAASRIVANADFSQNLGNQIFARSCMRWLVGEDKLVAEIPPRDHALSIARIDSEQGTLLFVLLAFGLPGVVAFLGAVVWAVRRN